MANGDQVGWIARVETRLDKMQAATQKQIQGLSFQAGMRCPEHSERMDKLEETCGEIRGMRAEVTALDARVVSLGVAIGALTAGGSTPKINWRAAALKYLPLGVIAAGVSAGVSLIAAVLFMPELAAGAFSVITGGKS